MPDILPMMVEVLEFYQTPQALLVLILGSVVSLIFGAMPGISATIVIALLIPFSWGMSPMYAFILFGAAGGASCNLGGSIPAILLNTPGTVPNWATTLDGYPMTEKGKGGVALGAAASSAVLGSLIGSIMLIVIIPVISQILLSFSPPEFFLMAVIGISTIVFFTQGNIFRGLLSGAFGVTVALIGFDPLTGVLRYTFGIPYLYDGIEYIAAVIGLFAISEAIKLAVGGRETPAKVQFKQTFGDVLQGVIAPYKRLRLFIQSALIGNFIGIIPGAGGSIATMLAWAAGAATARKDVVYGTGVVEGVIATETALSAKDGGALLPTISFGIPGSAEMAVLLGAFLLHGLQPGPRLLTTQLPIVAVLVWAYFLSTIIVAITGVSTGKFLARVSNVPGNILAPIIIVLSLIGTYILNNSIIDPLVCISFGVLGYFMDKWGFSKVALALGLILGLIAERNFGLSLQMSDVGLMIFFTRPISIGLIVFILVAAFTAVVLPRLIRRSNRSE